jgi:hypothetical protein
MVAFGSFVFFMGLLYAAIQSGYLHDKAQKLTDKELLGYMISATGVALMYAGLVIKVYEWLP